MHKQAAKSALKSLIRILTFFIGLGAGLTALYCFMNWVMTLDPMVGLILMLSVALVALFGLLFIYQLFKLALIKVRDRKQKEIDAGVDRLHG